VRGENNMADELKDQIQKYVQKNQKEIDLLNKIEEETRQEVSALGNQLREIRANQKVIRKIIKK
jgi:hypothetical protein